MDAQGTTWRSLVATTAFQNVVLAFLEDAYDTLPAPQQAALTSYALSSPINISASLASQPGFAVNYLGPTANYIGLNLEELAKLTTIGQSGQVVKIPIGVAIYHELFHIISGSDDIVSGTDVEADQILQNGANYVYDGPTVVAERVLMDAMGLGDQARVSYRAAMFIDPSATSPLKALTESYTEFNQVDIVRFSCHPTLNM